VRGARDPGGLVDDARERRVEVEPGHHAAPGPREPLELGGPGGHRLLEARLQAMVAAGHEVRHGEDHREERDVEEEDAAEDPRGEQRVVEAGEGVHHGAAHDDAAVAGRERGRAQDHPRRVLRRRSARDTVPRGVARSVAGRGAVRTLAA
jgi:hypothetical protein